MCTHPRRDGLRRGCRFGLTNRTTVDGLGSDIVEGVAVDGSTVYAATRGGLSISTDGGTTFSNRTTSQGLGSNTVLAVAVNGSIVYAGTDGGLSISTDGGTTFTNRTTSQGLGSNTVLGVAVEGSTVYAATSGGLSISTDGGTTFTNRTTTNGLGDIIVKRVAVDGSTFCAATDGGLSISTDEGGAPSSASIPPTTYTFTFNTSTGGECFTDVAVTAGAYRLPDSTVSCTPEGTELVGWSIPGQSTSFSDGGTVITSADQTFTAVARNPHVRITYDANVADNTACLVDGRHTTARQSTVRTPREGALMTTAPCTPLGYVLVGWTDQPTTDGPTRAVDGSIMLAPGHTTPTSWNVDPNPVNDIHLYAVWGLS